ncbi:Anp1-domain-containing protein [Scheffersomyces coipomensis]|uniref:Anp1-domain-containing protein n=1 Tax=Scheffersomyces coipomensis TaxID=1788519 RepID=UPI00315C5357
MAQYGSKGLPRKLSLAALGALSLLLLITYSFYQREDELVSGQLISAVEPAHILKSPLNGQPIPPSIPETLEVEAAPVVPAAAPPPAPPPPPPFEKIEYSHPHSSFKRIEYIKSSHLKHTTSQDTVLILVNVGQQSPYGKDRTIRDLFATIDTLYAHQPVDQFSISFGFLCNGLEDFRELVSFFDEKVHSLVHDLDFISKVTLLTNPELEANVGFDRDSRQRDEVQRFRRRLIAKNRNFLTSSVLRDEEYVLFLDADIYKFDNPDIVLSTFIKSKKDIIVPRVARGGNNDYDKNSWRGERTKPSSHQLKLLDENNYDEAAYVPMDVKPKMFHFQNFVEQEQYKEHHGDLTYNFELDSVGGAVLFVRSIVIKLGVVFPTSYVVGTTWDRPEGYDGIETEGLCYLAKPLGFKCWGYPNIVAQHIDDF